MQYLQETARELSVAAELSIPAGISYDELEALLAQQLEMLVSNDFRQFVLLLYRVDVPEDKVRLILEADPAPEACRKIAGLLIARQLQKIATRAAFQKPPPDDDEEKW